MKKLIFCLLLVLSIILYCFFPLIDPDLWWHIKTGEFIVENLSLPHSDPFSFVLENTERSEFILTQYWLAQILWFIVFKVFGLWGLIALRTVIYFSIFAIFWVLAKDLNYYLKTGILGFLIFGLSHYINDRPSALSFLFFALILYALKKEKLIFIPFLMLLWSNCHGGFIVGDALIAVWMFCGLFDGSVKGKNLLFLIAGLCLSLLNPNTYKAFTLTFTTIGSDYAKNIMEFKSPIEIYKTYKPIWFVYIALCVVSIIALIIPKIKQVSLKNSIVLLGLGVGALFHYRLAPFLYIALALLSVDYLKAYNLKIPSKLWRVDLVIAGLLLFVIIFFSPRQKPQAFLNEVYPVNAAEFILNEKPEKEIFNSFEWGGYLTFRLYPEYKVFTDTRALSMKTFSDLKEFEFKRDFKIFNKYNVNTAVVYIMSPYLLAEMSSIVKTLHDDNEWELVYLQDIAAIFLKKTKHNEPIIAKYKLPKDAVYTQLILVCALLLKTNKDNPYLYFMLGDTYVLLKDFERAKQAYEVGLDVREVPGIREKLEQVKKYLSSKSTRQTSK